MTLASPRAAGVLVGRPCCSPRRAQAVRAVRRDPFHRRPGAGRRDRPLRPHHCRAHGQDARPHHHCREPAWRERQHLRAVHRRQPADGQFIWLGTQALTEIIPSVFENLRWKIDDFLPLIKGVQAPLVFVVHPSVPAANFAEFLDLGEGEPRQAQLLLLHAGTPSHFLGFQLNEKFDLDLTHVPYRGSGLQTNGLLAGHSLFGFAQVNTSTPQYAAGKLKAFGTTERRALAVNAGRADLRRAGPAGIHRRGLVRSPGEEGTPPDTRRPAHRRRQCGARRSRGAQQARSPGLRGHRRNRAATPRDIKTQTRALGPDREGVRLFGSRIAAARNNGPIARGRHSSLPASGIWIARRR